MEAVKLGTLKIYERFIMAKDLPKRTPTFKVLGNPEFNIRHGSATRECKNEVTKTLESKSCRVMVYKLPLNQ